MKIFLKISRIEKIFEYIFAESINNKQKFRTMKALGTTGTGRHFRVSSNKSARTFTVVVDGTKYRTVKMNKEEFQSCLNYTANDWNYFLKSSSDYYVVK